MEEISFDLVGKILEQDIVSELDVLLLKKGTVLTETNILLLKNHNYKKVKVSENLSFKATYLKNIKHIEELFANLKQLNDVDIKEWFEKEKRIVRHVQKDVFFLEHLYNMDGQPTIYRHSANVGLVSFFLGKLLRYSYNDKLLLWQMGLLHDIGKLRLADELLIKEVEEFNEEEMREYKGHPELGWELLKNVKGVNATILNAARYHHEKIDGSGFSKGLKVKYLPVMVQIISVANTIDKLLMEEITIFQLVEQLNAEARENKLNPAIVIPFTRRLLRRHIGRYVVLNDQSKAELVFVFDNEPADPLVYNRETDTFFDLRKLPHLKIVAFA